MVWSPICAVLRLPLLFLSHFTPWHNAPSFWGGQSGSMHLWPCTLVSLTQRNASPGDLVLLERPDLLSGWVDVFLGDIRLSKLRPKDKNVKWPKATSYPQLLSPQTGFSPLGFINQPKENVRYSHQRISALRRERDWRQESATVYVAKPLCCAQ